MSPLYGKRGGGGRTEGLNTPSRTNIAGLVWCFLFQTNWVNTTWFECFGFGECFACRVWVASKTCALFSGCFSLICSGSLYFFTSLLVFFSRHATNEQVRPIILLSQVIVLTGRSLHTQNRCTQSPVDVPIFCSQNLSHEGWMHYIPKPSISGCRE